MKITLFNDSIEILLCGKLVIVKKLVVRIALLLVEGLLFVSPFKNYLFHQKRLG